MLTNFQELTSFLALSISTVLLEPDSKDWLVNEFLVDGLLENGLHAVDGKAGESKSKDTVQRLSCEEVSKMNSLTKGNFRNNQLIQALIAQRYGVFAQEAGSGASSVLDGPVATI